MQLQQPARMLEFHPQKVFLQGLNLSKQGPKGTCSVRLFDRHKPILQAAARAINSDPKIAYQIRRLIEGATPPPVERHALYKKFERLALRVMAIEHRLNADGLSDSGYRFLNKIPPGKKSAKPKNKKKSNGRTPIPEKIKERARSLIYETNLITGEVHTRAEIEAILISEFGLTRNQAQSLSRRTVSQLDPDSSKRSTYRKAIGRRVSAKDKVLMRSLYDQGYTIRAIGKKIGADEKTVSIHLGLRKKSSA